nr:hypothetical protein [Tanacetum cinerariifolium]
MVKLLMKKLNDFEEEYQVLGMIVRIKSLLDAVGITAAQIYVNIALMKLVLLVNFNEKYTKCLLPLEFDPLKWDQHCSSSKKYLYRLKHPVLGLNKDKRLYVADNLDEDNGVEDEGGGSFTVNSWGFSVSEDIKVE